MNWKKALGFGALLWAIMFVLVSAFIGFRIYDLLWLQNVTIVIGGIIAFFLAGYLKPNSLGLALGYGFSWVIVGIILDAIISMRFAPDIFSSWTLWLSYFLVLIAPTVRLKK